MCECQVLCLLMVLMTALDSSSALNAPTGDVNPICNTTTETLIPHPTKCAQYYNCSAPAAKTSLKKNLQECPFPELYNPATQRCEHYSMVQCGNRTEPLGKCEYELYKRSEYTSRCLWGWRCRVPCEFYNPTCRNLSDGLNVNGKRLNSPYYAVCVNQRLVYTGECHDFGTGPPIFDAKLRACRNVNPICKTTTETLIPHPTKCAQYYNCSAPAAKSSWEQNLQECTYPQLYNPGTQRCEHYSMVTCGNRTEPLGICEYEFPCFGGRYCGAPCHVYNPSCRNLSDGLNVYEYRLKSPYYVMCVDQRLVYRGECHDFGTGRPIFDAKLRACRCS